MGNIQKTVKATKNMGNKTKNAIIKEGVQCNDQMDIIV